MKAEETTGDINSIVASEGTVGLGGDEVSGATRRSSSRLRNQTLSSKALERIASTEPNFENPVPLNVMGENKRPKDKKVVLTLNTTAYALNSASKKQPKTNKISSKLPAIPKSYKKCNRSLRRR